MEIRFATKLLEKCANDITYAQKKLGKQRSDLFFKRISMLYAATSFEDLRHVPGHFHELKFDRKGQWGWSLDEPYRLIVKPFTNHVTVDDNGMYVWDSIRDVAVIEIVNYHKEK